LFVEQVLHKLGNAMVLFCQTSHIYAELSHHMKCIMSAGAKTANYKPAFNDKNAFLLQQWKWSQSSLIQSCPTKGLNY